MLLRTETEHLILSVATNENAKDVLDFYVDNQHLFDAYEPTRPQNFYTEAYHKACLTVEYDNIIHHRFLRYYIYLKTNPTKIIGSINFSDIVYGAFLKATIGYKLDQNYHHQGYALEACKHVIDIMFNDYQLERIEAKVLPSNSPSIRVLENLNFRFEGMEYSAVSINNSRVDLHRYSLTK